MRFCGALNLIATLEPDPTEPALSRAFQGIYILPSSFSFVCFSRISAFMPGPAANRHLAQVAIAIVAETCGPFTVLPGPRQGCCRSKFGALRLGIPSFG